jgi:Rieske 2Fe-2S family protein
MEEVAVKLRDVMPEGARTLPARYYTDPVLLKAELDGLFGTMWFYAGRSEEAQRPGQYFVRELNGHNIVVTRNAGGEVRAFHNICRHRGTRICSELTGQFTGSIQCPYHAWTYDLDGRLIGAPHMNEVPHFNKSDYPLQSVHAAEWDGHIFLNLSAHPEPLGAQLGRGRIRGLQRVTEDPLSDSGPLPQLVR